MFARMFLAVRSAQGVAGRTARDLLIPALPIQSTIILNYQFSIGQERLADGTN
jgi:hypothetical protein